MRRNQLVTIGIGIVLIFNILILIIVFFLSNRTNINFNFYREGITYNSSGTPNMPVVTSHPTETPIPVATVVIAIQDIPRGVEIQPNMVELVNFPLEFLPQGTFDDLNSVIGRIARTDISRSQLVLSRQIIAGPFTQAAAEVGRVGGDIAAVLEAGRVGITLHLHPNEVPEGLQPGDTVDLLYTLPSASDNQQVVLRSIKDARIIWIGTVPVDGYVFRAAPAPTPTLSSQSRDNVEFATRTPIPYLMDDQGRYIITLSVTPQDAVTINWATREGLPLTLVVRSARAVGLPETIPMDYDTFMEIYAADTSTPTLTPTSTATPTATSTPDYSLTSTAFVQFVGTLTVEADLETSIPALTPLSDVQHTATALASMFIATPSPDYSATGTALAQFPLTQEANDSP